MKNIIVILLCAASLSAKSQTTQITVDSLSSIIKAMQKQITALQKIDTIAFDISQMTLTRTSPASQFLTIKNYSAITNTATLTTQLTAALVRITTLEASLKTLQTKVTGLKAVSTTTTLIQ